MADDNLSCVVHSKNDLRLIQRPIPKPAKNQVLLAMQNVGICGSDVHILKHGEIGNVVLNVPMVLGHEASGVVIQLGEEVTNLNIGDRVAIEPGVPCCICDYCLNGTYNQCNKLYFCSSPHDDGNLCRYYAHAANFCHKLPDHVSCEEGALLEPLSVAVNSCRRAGVTIGNRVLICGAGPIGLVMLLVAKAFGASSVAITDLDEFRLEMAKNLGASMTFKITSKDGKEVAEMINNEFGKVDKAIECTGVESCVHTSIYATARSGTVVLVGFGSKKMISFPVTDIIWREIDIRGNFRYCNSYPTALELVASGKINVKPLVTHRFKLEEAHKAFETSAGSISSGAIKVMFSCQKE